MKKLMCFALAICMVFVLGGVVLAEELTPQIVYTNPTQTYDKEINGTRWLVEFVKNVDACQQTNEFPCAQDWDFIQSRYCECWEPGDEMFKDQRCEWYNCMCCEVPRHQGVIKRDDKDRCCGDDIAAFSLIFDTDLDWQSCWNPLDSWDSSYYDKFSWADFVTKVTIEPGCEYIDYMCYNRDADEERCFDEDKWDEYFDTAPYPYCIPCDVEVLYCTYEDTVCVLDDDDDDCGPCVLGDSQCDDDDDCDGCDKEILCSWFHPDLEFTRENDEATRPTFSEVIYGGRKLKVRDSDCLKCWKDYYRAGETTFLTRYKWYDYEVINCDECEEPGDVVLWKTCHVECDDDDDDACEPCCDATYQFVRYFTMDLLNCDNISGINLEFPVCCPCDADAEWGIWKMVEVDECDEDCVWEPLDTTFNENCDTPACGDEECDCSLELALSGACADDCNSGELCALEGDTFALGWYLPQYMEGNFGSVVYKVKTYACDPTECVTADIVEAECPDPCTSGDLFFEPKFVPADGEGICKIVICMEDVSNGDFGIFLFDEDTGLWISLAEGTGEVCATYEGDASALLGTIWGAGDPADFPTEAPAPGGDDDDDDDSGTNGPVSSSGGGCNVGTGAAVLLLLAPLGALWFRRF